VARACLPGVRPDRVAVVPSFVADDVAVGAALGPRPDFLPGGEFVLFVGALGEHKGVGLLAEAHRRMVASVPLVVIGSRRADSPALSGGPRRPLVLRDGVPHPEIMAAFAAAAVVAVPSRWPEPQGLVAVEAMASGVPVVASGVGGLAEVVLPGETGLLVRPGDAGALAGALDQLLADPALRLRMGAAAKVRAVDFAAASVVPQVIEAYHRARVTTAA
jgi:glycosyltransferase involved in cell wall biosynthesis